MVLVVLLAGIPSPAAAQNSRSLQCANKIIPHSAELIRRTRAKAAADPAYAQEIRKTDTTLTRAWNATLKLMHEEREAMANLVQRWNERKAKTHKLPNGHAIGPSRNGKVYDLDDKVVVAVNASAYNWSGRPTWEDYLAVRAEYDKRSAKLNELFKYYCQTLIPARNRVVPYGKLNL